MAKRLGVSKAKAKEALYRSLGFPSVGALVKFLKRQRKKRDKKL